MNYNIDFLCTPKMSRYIPHAPTPKQQAFLILPHEEALFGGSLGSGKSDALLASALQYADVPGYSALILRKSLSDLKQSGALLDRANEWLREFVGRKDIKYIASDHKYEFPTFTSKGKRAKPAVLQFGYIGDSTAYSRYQGIELNFCGFDEVCQHKASDYEYLLTRLRKNVCPLHTERDDENNPIYHSDCEECNRQRTMPIRMRSTANPEGVGFQWVKERFKISPHKKQHELKEGEVVRWIGKEKNRPFIPATFRDNPYLDHKSYEERLRRQLSPSMQEALIDGSWGVVANARFSNSWKRYYSVNGQLLYLGANLSGRILDMRTDIRDTFQTVDVAASSKEGPGDVDIHRGRVKSPSSTVISTWVLTKCYNLLWLNMLEFREEIPEVVDMLEQQYRIWRPSVVIVEENGVGKGVSQYASRMGMRIHGLHKDKDKIVNATNAILKMKEGRIWFPQDSYSWKTRAEEVVFNWQGHPSEPDDIIDTLAHAANYVQWENAGSVDAYAQHNTGRLITEIPKTFMQKSIYGY